ncbi:MAG: RNA polymerase sigma factor, partial [Planctomycetota bacterium]
MSRRPSEFDAERLLAHVRFVRSIARSLLGDENQVDDVTQQTLLTALERRPRKLRDLRAWMGKVARNFALRTRRSAGRRSRHERAAARTNRVSSAATVVERLEVQRRVVEAVLTLDEPYRTTV